MGKRGDKRRKKAKALRKASSYVNRVINDYADLYNVGLENFDKAYEQLQEAKGAQAKKALSAQRKFDKVLRENLVPGSNKQVNIETLRDFFLKKDKELPLQYEELKDDRELKLALIREFYELQDEGYFTSDADWKLNYMDSDRIVTFFYETVSGNEFDFFLDRARRRKQERRDHSYERPLAKPMVTYEELFGF